MSDVAEFACNLSLQYPLGPSPVLQPLKYPSGSEKLFDIKAVIFDVYGTLINYWKPAFGTPESKDAELLAAFEKTVERFQMNETLLRMNPACAPRQTLRDFYHGLIALSHQDSLQKSEKFPEVKIEQIWKAILLMLKRNGYAPLPAIGSEDNEYARCMAYFYNFHALGRGMYPGVTETLNALRKSHVRLGIVSNAQFYTPIDLTLFIREQSARLEDYSELFDPDLVFFSYEYGSSKPGPVLFRRLYDALYEYQILPAQTVYVGNDLVSDIKPAADIGMRTAFFCGDANSAFIYDRSEDIIPDISFMSWDELPQKLSFFGEPSKN